MGHSRKSARSGAAKWACEHGCEQAYYLEKFGHYCPHLESLLPAVVGQDNRRTIYTGNIEAFSDEVEAPFQSPADIDEEELLRRKLLTYGLTRKAADVVIDRTVNNKTFKEIALERGYRHAQGAHNAFTTAIQKLKDRGFKNEA